MKQESIKQWFSRVFTRDINIPRKTFMYLLFSLLAIMLIVEALIAEYMNIISNVSVIGIEVIIFIIIIAVAFFLSGIIVDFIKHRTRYFNLTLAICVIGLLISAIPPRTLYYLGLLIVLLTIPQLIIVWFTILVHETNILNRGRISTYLLIPCFNLGAISIIFFVFDSLYVFFGILELCIFLIIFWYSRSYNYLETKDRLESDKKYSKIVFEKHFFRYSSSFTILSFTLGGLMARYTFEIELPIFLIVSSLYLIAAGCFLDNFGRKISIVLGILVVSFFLISYNSFVGESYIFGIPRTTFLSIHYGLSIGPLILAIFTIAGDFSTERGNLKFRGRINGIFMQLFFVGAIIGFIFSKLIDSLPGIENFIPNFPNLLNSIILVILLVWMMGMKEFLVSKEKKWAFSLNNILVFSKSGVCLYNHNFKKTDKAEEEKEKTKFDQDLVSGALTGIITIINEITQSKKQLRKIDKEGGFLLFGYGKYHVVALIATMELPVLFKKIDEFSREFENIFMKELKSFQGNVHRFIPTKYLIKKYFSQKYSEFAL
jgi:MFS family permease